MDNHVVSESPMACSKCAEFFANGGNWSSDASTSTNEDDQLDTPTDQALYCEDSDIDIPSPFVLFEVALVKQLWRMQRVFGPDAWKLAKWEDRKRMMFFSGLDWMTRLLLFVAGEINVYVLARAYTNNQPATWTAFDLFIVARDVARVEFDRELTYEGFKSSLQLLICCHFLDLQRATWEEGCYEVNVNNIQLGIVNPVELKSYIAADIFFDGVVVFA